MSEITMRNVNKSYGKVDVIRDVNLTIKHGEFAVFVGPSGCGKSTLLRMVAGLEDITSGDMTIDGQRVNDLPPAKRGVAMVFQSYALYPHMTIYDNMAFGLKLARESKESIEQRVTNAARILQIEHLLKRLPKELSGGQRQRVAIGRAIVRDPKVFLFDEPLSNLDAALRVQTRLEISKLHHDMPDTSMIYVTHDQVEAMTLADKIVLLNAGQAAIDDGSVAQCGSPLELYHHPQNLFVAGFIGSPKMNFLKATLSEPDSSHTRVTLSDGSSLEAAVDTGGAMKDADVTLGIRPEHLEISDQGPGVKAQVQYVENLGEATYLYLDHPCAETHLVVRKSGDVKATIGETLTVRIDPQCCHLFASDRRAFKRIIKTETETPPPP